MKVRSYDVPRRQSAARISIQEVPMGLATVVLPFLAYAAAVALAAAIFWRAVVTPHEAAFAQDLRDAQAEIRNAAEARARRQATVVVATTAGQALEESLSRARKTMAITGGGR